MFVGPAPRQPDRRHGRRRGQRDRNSGGNGVGILRGGSDTRGNRVLRNRIFANVSLGIDLGGNAGADGVTPNDANDADTVTTRANEGQNFPVITAAVTTGGTTVATGTLDAATAGTQYRIEILPQRQLRFLRLRRGGDIRGGRDPHTRTVAATPASRPRSLARRRRGAHRHRHGLPADPHSSGTSRVLGMQDGDGALLARRATRGRPARGDPRCPPPVVRRSFNTSVERRQVTAKCPGQKPSGG